MKKSKKDSKRKSGRDPLDSDMSQFLESANWQKTRFEFKPKNKTITIRMSKELLMAVKEKAKESGLDYQKYIRIKLEQLIFDEAA